MLTVRKKSDSSGQPSIQQTLSETNRPTQKGCPDESRLYESTTRIPAKQLKVSDKVLYFTGDIWQVLSKPKSTRQGLSFEVFNITTKTNQNVIFDPNWRFELLQ